MMSQAAMPARIVLQGEYCVTAPDGRMRAPFVSAASILILIGKYFTALAYIDEYTSATSAIQSINQALIGRYDECLSSRSFSAYLITGSLVGAPERQKAGLLAALQVHNKAIEILQVRTPADRFQVWVEDQKIFLLTKEAIHWGLEYLQMREYGAWNDLLDLEYGGVFGAQIPEFKAKEAKRTETFAPLFGNAITEEGWSNYVKGLQVMERQHMLSFPIYAQREALVPTRPVDDITGIDVDRIIRLEKRPVHVATFLRSPTSIAAITVGSPSPKALPTPMPGLCARFFQWICCAKPKRT